MEGDATGHSRGGLAVVYARAALLRVVVRAGAPRQEPEPIVERAELRRERVGDPGLEPADAAGRPAGEDRAGGIRVAQRAIDAVQPPDREHVRGVAAADHDDVLLPDAIRATRRLEVEEQQMRRLAVEPGHRLIEGQPVGLAVTRRGAEEQDARPFATREREEVLRERGVVELAATAGEDASRHRPELASVVARGGSDALDGIFERFTRAVERRGRTHAVVPPEPPEHRRAPGETAAERHQQYLVAHAEAPPRLGLGGAG